MAEPRSKRTGEHNEELVKLNMDAAVMRERLAALETRVAALEGELMSLRGGSASTNPGTRSGNASSLRPSKRPGGVGAVSSTSTGRMPPPLPPAGGVSLPPSGRGGRRSVVDISEIAELVESMPPPPHTPRK